MNDMTQWILSSSVLILGVLILRKMLKGRISLRLQYALWLLVLVRLLCPVNFFQSSMSIQNAVIPIQQQIVQFTPADDLPEQTPVEQTPVTPQNPTTQLQPSVTPQQPSQSPVVQTPQNPVEQEQNQISAQPVEIAPAEIAWESVLLLIWAIGAVAMFSFTMGANIQFSRMLAKNRRELDVPVTAVPVYVSSAVKTPCLVGIFRPVIYLTPEVAEDRNAWSHVIRHELTHLDHFDHVFSFLRCLALCLHWFNPLVWIAARISKDDCELACDEGTIARLGEQERIPYGQTLIRMTCRSAKASDLMIAATTMLGSKSAIKERITLIAKRPRTLAAALIACVVAIAIMVGCTFTGAVDSTEPEETTVPTETTEPVETTEPTVPPESTSPVQQIVPLGYLDLAELLSGTDIVMTVEGNLVYLQEDGLTLILVQDSPYVYRYGYIMRALGRGLKVNGEKVYISTTFRDFLQSPESDTLSLFHGCYFFAGEVIESLEAPIQTEFTRKLLEEVTDPSSMGITLARLNPGRVIQTQTEYGISNAIQNDLIAMGLPVRSSLTYTENNEISGGRTWRDVDLTSGYEELSEERKAFLAEKQIYYYDHQALMQAFGWEYLEQSDDALRVAIEQDYNVDYEFVEALVKDTDLSIPAIEANLENFANSLIAYGGTVRHSGRDQAFSITHSNRQLLIGRAVEDNSWTKLENGDEPKSIYLEFTDLLGNRIRFYDAGYGIAAIYIGDTVQYWEATPLKDTNYTAFERMVQFYYTCETGFENLSCTADSYEEAAQLMGEQVAARHIHAAETSPYYALEYVVFEILVNENVTDGASVIECEVRYAIRQPELSYVGYGNVKDGTGEYEGWLVINQWFSLIRSTDGTWYCGSA